MPMPEIELTVINPRKPGKRLFGPDNPPPGKGRPRGSVNKANRDLKNGLLSAAINLGRDGEGTGGLIGYLEYLGWRHPKAFAGLLGKLLPHVIAGDGLPVARSIDTVNVISVPTDFYLTPEAIAHTATSAAPLSSPLKYEPRPEPVQLNAPPPDEAMPAPIEAAPESDLDCAMAMGYVPLPPRARRID